MIQRGINQQWDGGRYLYNTRAESDKNPEGLDSKYIDLKLMSRREFNSGAVALRSAPKS